MSKIVSSSFRFKDMISNSLYIYFFWHAKTNYLYY